MAEETDSHDKTEEPTGKRLADARKRGDVPKTPDLSAAMALAASIGVLVLAGGWMSRDMMLALVPFIAHPEAFSLYNGGAIVVLHMALKAALPLVALVMVATSLAGMAGNLMQSGFMLTGEKLKPDFKKVSPMAGFKRLFGVDGLMQFVKSLLKVFIISVVCYVVLKPYGDDVLNLIRMEPVALLPLTAAVLKALAFSVLGVLLAGALADFFWQRFRFMQRMRMSREEVKEEMKQSEGDPHIKARLKQQRIERSRRRMMQNVPKATVVITNPTHFAVALRYEAGVTAAPECLARGTDKVALRIREEAARHGVPIIEDPPLARALFATVEVDQVIPEQHFQAVAKIIGFIMNAARKNTRPAHV